MIDTPDPELANKESLRQSAEAPSNLGAADSAPSTDPDKSSRKELRSLKPGTLVASRYKVIEEIGHGGMGIVYKVEQVFLRHNFALKLLNTSGSSEKALLRFQKEAQAASRLDHPNLIRVHDFGLLDDGLPFLAMDIAHGTPMSDCIRKQGPLPLDDALDIFIQISDGLAYAHDQGIIHRDLKPSNIILGSAQSPERMPVKVVDFGIAKILAGEDESAQTLTRTGEIFGSPLYMSPEQCLGERVDQRSDIYSIGCALFEALTGVPPLVGENALATMLKHQTETPPRLKEITLGDDFPDALESVLAKMLAKEPGKRYQHMSEVKRDLQLVRTGGSVALATEGKASGFALIRPSGAWLAGIVALSALALAPIALLWESPAEQKNAPAVKKVADFDLQEALQMQIPQTGAPGGEVPEKPFAPIPVSALNGRKWVFDFPNDVSLGRIRMVNEPLQDAKGKVTFDKYGPLWFQPSSGVCEQANWFRCFRPDELDGIDMCFNSGMTDETLKEVSRLTGLKRLTMENTELTDKGLAYVANLPNLIYFNGANVKGITAAGLLRMKSFKRLKFIEVDYMKDTPVMLDALAGSTTVQRLKLKGCELNDADMKKAALIPGLRFLHVERNGLTDAGIANLVPLAELRGLDVKGNAITPGAIKYLKQMKHLGILHIDLRSWSNDDINELRLAMPRVEITTSPS